MDIQDFGALGEVVGAVAVIATLVYLARQIRQANNSTHRQMYAQAATAVSEFWFNLAKEPELHALFQQMLSAPDSLTPQELERSYLVLDGYLALMESYYLHNREFKETESQDRWRRILERMMNAPGAVPYWQKRQFAFHEDFSAYISSLVRQESKAS